MGGDLDSPMPEDEDVEMSDASKKSPQKIEEPINFSQANESDMPIDELLKQNNDEDIIVEFYHNGELLQPNTSVYEICREPTTEPQIKNMKDLLSQI